MARQMTAVAAAAAAGVDDVQIVASSLITSADFNNFYISGGMITAKPWVGLNEVKKCDAASKTCSGFTLAGTSTVMTNMQGVNSMTIDAVLQWPTEPIGNAPVRNFGKDMEIGWNIEIKDPQNEYNSEQVSFKYWASGWPSGSYKPAPLKKKKPATGESKWVMESRQLAGCAVGGEQKCAFKPGSAKGALFEPLWTEVEAENGENITRVVATRLFKDKNDRFNWKLGEKKKWSVFFTASAKKNYAEESDVMELSLEDTGRRA